MNLNHFPPIAGTPAAWGWGPAYAWVFGVTGLTTVLIYLFLRKKRWM
jgi:hypothetical protein